MNSEEEFNLIFNKVSYFGARTKSTRGSRTAITSEMIVGNILIFSLECVPTIKALHFRIPIKKENGTKYEIVEKEIIEKEKSHSRRPDFQNFIRICWEFNNGILVENMMKKMCPKEYGDILKELKTYTKLKVICNKIEK